MGPSISSIIAASPGASSDEPASASRGVSVSASGSFAQLLSLFSSPVPSSPDSTTASLSLFANPPVPTGSILEAESLRPADGLWLLRPLALEPSMLRAASDPSGRAFSDAKLLLADDEPEVFSSLASAPTAFPVHPALSTALLAADEAASFDAFAPQSPPAPDLDPSAALLAAAFSSESRPPSATATAARPAALAEAASIQSFAQEAFESFRHGRVDGAHRAELGLAVNGSQVWIQLSTAPSGEPPSGTVTVQDPRLHQILLALSDSGAFRSSNLSIQLSETAPQSQFAGGFSGERQPSGREPRRDARPSKAPYGELSRAASPTVGLSIFA